VKLPPFWIKVLPPSTEYSRGSVPDALIIIVPLLKLHAVSLVTAVDMIVGMGLTVIVYEDDGPTQPFSEGVTLMFAVIPAAEVLVAIKLGIFPVPLAGSPIAGFELVQVRTVPGGLLVKLVDGTVVPAHKIELSGTLTVGSGFIVMVKLYSAPLQLFSDGVIVIVAMMGELELLMAVNDGILPFPFAARPISGFELLQLMLAPGGLLLKMLDGTVDPSQ
jgi:hypothetical protein